MVNTGQSIQHGQNLTETAREHGYSLPNLQMVRYGQHMKNQSYHHVVDSTGIETSSTEVHSYMNLKKIYSVYGMHLVIQEMLIQAHGLSVIQKMTLAT